MAVRLGDVSFGLGADTAGLLKAVEKLSQFSKLTDQVARSQEAGAARVTAAYVRQEHAIRDALQQTLKLQAAMRTAAAPPEMIANTTRQFQSLTNAMTSGVLSAQNFSRQQDLFRARLGHSSRALKDYGQDLGFGISNTGKFTDMIRQLQSASILAVGPLSGLGARINALGAITSRSNLAIAGFVAGATGMTLILGKLVSMAIKSETAYMRIESGLKTVIGSTTLAQDEFGFLTEQARRLGLNLESLAQNYVQLTASAKGTTLAGKQTKEIFIGVAEAAAALSLPAARVEKAYLAITQMVSKGVVSQEELRQQLSEALPGAFNLAAKAMGVSTRELNKMLRSGDVLATELLPKLAKELRAAFGSEAERNAQRITGAVENLRTAMFQFGLSLDNVTGATSITMHALQLMTKTFDFLRENINNVVRVIGAITGALLTLAGPMILRGIVALGTWMFNLARAITAVSIALTAASFTNFMTAIGRIGLAIGGAVAGMLLFNQAIDDGSGASQALIADIDQYIQRAEAMGGALKENTQQLLVHAKAQLATGMATYSAAEAQYEQNKALADSAKALGLAGAFMRIWTDAAAEASKGEALEALENMKKIREQIDLLSNIPDLDIGGFMGDDDSGKKQNALNNLKELITELKAYQAAVKAMPNKETAEGILALADAQNKIRDVPTAELANMAKLLKEEGFWVGSVEASLASLNINLEFTQNKYKGLIKALEDTPPAVIEATMAIDELGRRTAATLAGPIALKAFEQQEKINESVAKMATSLEAAQVPTQQMIYLLDQYRLKLIAYDIAVEKTDKLKKMTDAVKGAIDKSFDRIGEAITEAFVKGEIAALNFMDVLQGVLSELIQFILQLSILDPLKNIIGNFIGGAGGGSPGLGSFYYPMSQSAKGNIFSNSSSRIQKLARGGIVNKPSIINFGGALSQVAEAGRSEAVLPLERVSGGDLGVKASVSSPTVVVNIINKTDSEVSAQQRPDGRGGLQLDVMITKAVAKSVKEGGVVARAISDTFGMKPALSKR